MVAVHGGGDAEGDKPGFLLQAAQGVLRCSCSFAERCRTDCAHPSEFAASDSCWLLRDDGLQFLTLFAASSESVPQQLCDVVLEGTTNGMMNFLISTFFDNMLSLGCLFAAVT